MKKVCYSFEKEKYAKTNCNVHQLYTSVSIRVHEPNNSYSSVYINYYTLCLSYYKPIFDLPRSFLFAADGAINRIMSSNTQFYYLSVSIITTLYSSLMFIYTDLIAKLLSIQKKEVTIAVVTYLPLYDWQGL